MFYALTNSTLLKLDRNIKISDKEAGTKKARARQKQTDWQRDRQTEIDTDRDR